MDQTITDELLAAGRDYENLYVKALFDAWTQPVLEAVHMKPGDHVLDIACGTGVLSRKALAATGPSGRVVGADPAPGMLAAAAEIEPAITWVLCPAEALDAQDATFDRVISQFGMMFFNDRQKAAEEMFRVLKPGGTLAIATWRSVDYNPVYAEVIGLLEEHVSHAAADALRLPYSLGNADDIVSVLAASGFTDINVAEMTRQAAFPSTRQMVEAELRGWLPMFDIHLSEDHIADVLSAAEMQLMKYTATNGEAIFPTAAHIVAARKP